MEALHCETYSLSTLEATAGVCKPKEWRKPGIIITSYSKNKNQLFSFNYINNNEIKLKNNNQPPPPPIIYHFLSGS